MRHALRPGDGEGVDLRAADEHGVGPQRQRLEHIGAPADAAVHQHRHRAGDGVHGQAKGARHDWALRDVEAPGAGPGESWAWRAAHGRVPGVEPDAAVQALARSQVGLFEVWPGKPAVLRGRIRGLCLRVDDPALAAPLGERGRIAALWELRIVFTRDGARLCRPPIAYPLEILPRLKRAHEQHWRDPQRGLDLMQLRRMRLQWTRARKPDVRVAFG